VTVDLALGLKWYLVFLFSTVCHEAAHAWTAYKLGDDTAHKGGQVSLDPTPHIRREPFGMVVVPLLSYFLGGWLIGWASAPYSPAWAAQYPRRAAIMALAGPAANLILVALATLLMAVGCEWDVFRPSMRGFHQLVQAHDSGGLWTFAAQMLSLFFSLNLLLAVFNLIPFPPLDGSSLPLLFLTPGAAEKYNATVRQSGLGFLGLFIAWKVFGMIFPTVFATVSKLLYMLLGHS